MLSKEISNRVLVEGKEYIDTETYERFVINMISNELANITKKIGIKITDVNSNDKSDGCYVYLGDTEEEYIVKSVKNSIATSKIITKEDYQNILCYSYLVRIIAYLPNSNFEAIKMFTLKLNNVLKKYGC